MLWTLTRRELLDNLLTLRLAMALGFAVVLSVLTALIGSVTFSQAMDDYRGEVARVGQALDGARVYSQLRPTIAVPPQPLFILCRGTSEVSGVRLYVAHDYIAIPSMLRNAYTNDLMATLMQIDFTTVVMVLLSFLAVALGFDGICGERERGTLKLVLANPVPRRHIVVAKLAGGCLSLWIPLALSLVVSLAILSSNPDVHFTGEDWLRLVLFFGLSCAFLGQVYGLSLMVSACTRESSTSLILCLILWLTGGVGWASLLPSLVRYGTHEPPWQEYVDQARDLHAAHEERLAQWEESHPGPGEAYLRGIRHDGVLRYAHPRGYEYLQGFNRFRVEEELELADRQYQILWANQAPLALESRRVDERSILSPFTNYRTLARLLARSTIDDLFVLSASGRRYREAFVAYLRGKGAFTSRRWFTDDPEDQEPLIPHPEEVADDMLAPDAPFLKSRVAWSEGQQVLAASDPRRRLDTSDLPKFAGPWRRTLPESLALMAPGLLVLLLSTALGVLLTVRRFLRYDPR